MPFPNSFYRYQDELEAELRAAVGEGSSPLYTMMRYHLGWVNEKGQDQRSSGKMSRPTLCLLACEAVGGDWRSALPAAIAIELIHNFSLIHDDIQDQSWERRNRPTVWKVWGEAQGINAGDAMYALAQLTLLRLEERGIPLEKVVLLSRRLDQASLQLCEGQYLDLAYEDRLDIGTADYLDMIDKKTACLFEASLYLGALLGTDNESQVAALSAFGRTLGVAFQVHNDLQGIWGEEESSKKAPYSDIRNKKKTLPTIYALQNAGDEDRRKLTEIYGGAEMSTQDISRVLGILDRTGARRYAEGIRKHYHLEAVKQFAGTGIPESFQQELTQMAAFLLEQG